MKSRNSSSSRPLARNTILDDRFEIMEFLGAGGFGEVYRAKQLVFGHAMRDVALKLFKADRVCRENVHEVFSDAITLVGLQESSPSTEVAERLIHVYDVGILDGASQRAFISMKLIPGRKTLQNAIWRWKHGGMPVELSLTFLRQMLIPLAWMHTLENPAVHGDIKPDNVLMDADSQLILTDFGLAARLPLGSTGGAIPYQAPESLLGGTAEIAADIYATGLVWYEMLTGRHPFEDVGAEVKGGAEESAYLRAHQESRKWPMCTPAHPRSGLGDHRIPLPEEFNEELTQHPQLVGMLQKCLAYRPSERYSNARVLLAEIDRYVATGTTGPTPTPTPDPNEADRVALPSASRDKLVRDAILLLDSGEPDRAQAAAERALQDDSDFVPALLVFARALAALGQIDRAKQTCTHAQQAAPDDPEVFRAMADVFRTAGKPGMATAIEEQAKRLAEQVRKRTARR